MHFNIRSSSYISVSAVVLYLCATPCAATKPAPISVPVDYQQWVGYDGDWSPVTIRIGTPPQWVYLMPNVLSQEIWVIGPQGCDNTYTCATERGGIFKANDSSTWENVGSYALGFDTSLGVNGAAEYGYDDVALNQQIIAPGQIIGILDDTQFWMGSLGLGVQMTDFTNTNRLTFLSTLVENQSLVPSHSYSYTAGAYYRLKGVPASLILGGVDTNRYVQTDVSFTLDSYQQPVVAINGICATAQPGSDVAVQPSWNSPLTLASGSDAALFTIDSSTAFLWMPESVCDAFADALGLFYNETLQLYTYQGNSSNRTRLLEWNLNFIFTVADLPGSSNSVDLTLPFAAFDLQLTYPFPNLWANYTSPAVNYFPLRRAANSTQYTIGRMFLQETYLIVDYERNNFSLSQAKFSLDATTNTNIVEITRPANSNFTGPQVSTQGLTSGAKVGIAVGSVVGAIFLVSAIVIIILLRRRNKNPNSESTNHPNRKSCFQILASRTGSQASNDHGKTPIAELPASKRQPTEVAADKTAARFELEGSTPVEMEGSFVPSTFYSTENHRFNPPPGWPHGRSSSISKSANGPPEQRPDSIDTQNLPVYTASTENNRQGDSISPQSPTRSNGEFPTYSSVSPAVSPTTEISPNSVSGSGGGTYGLSPLSPMPDGTFFPNRTSNSHLTIPSSESSSLPRSTSTRSSRFRENIDMGPLIAAQQALGNGELGPDSGYHIREPGDAEETKLHRLTKLMRRSSSRLKADSGSSSQGREMESVAESSNEERRRFSWEEGDES